MGLLDTMKQVAQATNDAGMPTAFLFGSVTKTSPLTIRVDNRFDISGDAIVVMKEFQAGFYPTHYHTGVKGTLNENAYDLYIRIRLEGYAQRDALAATLGQMIPANLVLRLRTDIPQDDQPAKTAACSAMATMNRHKYTPAT